MSEKFDEILKGVYDYLTEEQKEKAKACMMRPLSSRQ